MNGLYLSWFWMVDNLITVVNGVGGWEEVRGEGPGHPRAGGHSPGTGGPQQTGQSYENIFFLSLFTSGVGLPLYWDFYITVRPVFRIPYWLLRPWIRIPDPDPKQWLRHNDPASHQDHFGSCRFRSRDLCPKSLMHSEPPHLQWKFASKWEAKYSYYQLFYLNFCWQQN